MRVSPFLLDSMDPNRIFKDWYWSAHSEPDGKYSVWLIKPDNDNGFRAVGDTPTKAMEAAIDLACAEARAEHGQQGLTS